MAALSHRVSATDDFESPTTKTPPPRNLSLLLAAAANNNDDADEHREVSTPSSPTVTTPTTPTHGLLVPSKKRTASSNFAYTMLLDGYHFHVCYKRQTPRGERVYWRCQLRGQCKARLITTVNGAIVQYTNSTHSHLPPTTIACAHNSAATPLRPSSSSSSTSNRVDDRPVIVTPTNTTPITIQSPATAAPTPAPTPIVSHDQQQRALRDLLAQFESALVASTMSRASSLVDNASVGMTTISSDADDSATSPIVESRSPSLQLLQVPTSLPRKRRSTKMPSNIKTRHMSTNTSDELDLDAVLSHLAPQNLRLPPSAYHDNNDDSDRDAASDTTRSPIDDHEPDFVLSPVFGGHKHLNLDQSPTDAQLESLTSRGWTLTILDDDQEAAATTRSLHKSFVFVDFGAAFVWMTGVASRAAIVPSMQWTQTEDRVDVKLPAVAISLADHMDAVFERRRR